MPLAQAASFAATNPPGILGFQRDELNRSDTANPAKLDLLTTSLKVQGTSGAAIVSRGFFRWRQTPVCRYGERAKGPPHTSMGQHPRWGLR
jgi:hypothetical protein